MLRLGTAGGASAATSTARVLGPLDALDALDGDARDHVSGQFLDRLDEHPVIGAGDAQRVATASRPAGAPDTVDIVLGMDRHVEIEHMAQAADVQAAGRDVRADQHLYLASLELLQSREAHRLGEVAMQRAGREAVLFQRLVQDVDVALAVAEDQRVLHVLGAQHAAQRPALVHLGDDDQALLDRGGHRGGPADRDLLGVLEEHLRKPADLRRHRRREEQGLAVRRQQRDDPLDIGDEAHVQHAVGFVDDQGRGLGEQQAAALEQIEQPPRGRDQHVDAAVERLLLVVHALAADQQGMAELEILAIQQEILGHLECQLAGRLQDQRARHPCPGPRSGQDVEQRQRE